MPYNDISTYFKNFGVVTLSKPRPKLDIERSKEFFNYVPKTELIAGTVTLGKKDIFKKDYYEKCYILEKALRRYSEYNKRTKYIAFMEDTKLMNPHLHLLIYNGYTCNFNKAFGPLGARNKNKESFKQVTDLNSYTEYITKEYTVNNDNKYYTNITIEDLDKQYLNYTKIINKMAIISLEEGERIAEEKVMA